MLKIFIVRHYDSAVSCSELSWRHSRYTALIMLFLYIVQLLVFGLLFSKSAAKVQIFFEIPKDTFFSRVRVYPCHVHIVRIDPFSKKEIIYKNEKSTQRVLRLLW